MARNQDKVVLSTRFLFALPWTILAFGLPSPGHPAAMSQVRRPPETSSRPNIVVFLADDQGWSESSVAMHPNVPGSRCPISQTPHLEALASQGMRFSSAYAPAPVCSPTRLSLLTGKSPAANHWTKAAPVLTVVENPKLLSPKGIKAIPTSEVTIAEVLRNSGYTTAHFGKWHLRGGGPGQHGFDRHDGDLGNEAARRFTDPNPVDLFGMAARAEEFMESSRAEGKPFYLQLSWHALHSPENALAETLAKYEGLPGSEKRVARYAITENLDTAVGRVLAAMDPLGLSENTYVVYTSDNGGIGKRIRAGKRGALSGAKGSLWEGGIRIPLIIRGPGIPKGSWSDEPVIAYDFYPTFCEWAGIRDLAPNIEKPLEGGSLVPVLQSGGQGRVTRARDALVFHFPHYQTDDGPHSAILEDDLKLIFFYETERTVLFDLVRDVSEENDLSLAKPAVVANLKRKLFETLVTLGAQMPQTNPEYDPSRSTDTGRENRRAKRGSRGKRKRGDYSPRDKNAIRSAE